MSIRFKLYIGFGITIFLAVVIFAISLISINNIRNNLEEVTSVQFQLERLGNDIRYYDAALANDVRAYLIDPQDEAALINHTAHVEALDGALQAARELSTSAESQQILADIDTINVDIIAIEAQLLETPDIEQAVALYRSTYNDLEAQYAAYLEQFFTLQRTELDAKVTSLSLAVNQTISFALGALAVLVVISFITVLVISRIISNPLVALTGLAKKIAQGDLNQRIPVTSKDEIGILAQTINDMSGQLQGFFGSLEEQVSERTRFLATTVEVGNLVTRINTQEELLPAVTDFIRSRFNLYYTQIYLLDETKRFALLRAGTGSVGQELLERKHKLDTDGTSLVANAVQSRQSVLVSNTIASEIHLPNPLLPDTKSEVAIPLLVGDEVIGVLDMQAAEINTFNNDNLNVFEAMASQLASALYGARAYTEIQTAIERAERLNERITSQNWKSYLGSLSTGGQVQYEFDVYGSDTIRLLDENTSLHDIALEMQDKQSLTQAVHLGGQSIGRILIREERERNWTNEERTLVADAAQRLAQAAEQFRAFDETEAARKLSATLYRIGQQLAATDSMDEILQAISTPEIVGDAISTSLFIFEFDEAGQPEWLFTAATTGQSITPVGSRFKLSEFGIAEIWMSSQTSALLVDNIHTDERVDANTRAVMEQLGTPGLLTLPLAVGGRWAGLITASWATPQQFKASHKELYQALIAPVATALNNLLLFGQTQKLAVESATLYNVGQQLAAADSLDEILSAVVTAGIMGEGATTTLYTFEFDADGNPEWLIVAAIYGQPFLNIGDRFYLPDFPFAQLWLNSQTEAQMIADVSTDERVDSNTRATIEQFGTPSLLTLPLTSSRRWVGLLVTQWTSKQTFNADNKALFQALISPVSTALNNLLLLDRTQQQASESASLYGIGQQLAAADSLNAILTAVATTEKMGEGATTTLYTFEFDEAGNPAWLIVAAIYGQAYINVGDRFYMPDFPIAEIWMSDQTHALVISDTATDSRVDANTRSLMEQFGTPSLLTLPLTTGRRWVGLFVTQWTSKQNFTRSDSEFFQALISPVSTALNNLLLLDQTQKRAVEMETVAQVGTVATSTLDMTELLQSVTDLTKSQFKLYHTHIYLLDEAHENLVLTAGAGEVGKAMQEKGHRILFNNPRSLVASAARNRRGVVVDDVTQAPDFLPNPLLPDTRSEMAVPMIIGDDVIGVLDAQSAEIARFDKNDVQVFTALASQVAVAVENARAFEREHETVQRLQEIDQLKSQFLANMSHELRTPLNSIIGYAGILAEGAEGELPEEALTDINIIHESGKHLLSIINDILDLAKIEAREMKLRFGPVELPKILDEVIRSGQVLANAKNVTLKLVQESEVPNVNADMVRMRQVTWNLVSNALKFTEKGSVTVRYGMLNEREMFVRIEDTGIGIPADFVNQVFERFRQVDETSTRAAGGTGLGLTITRELIHLHGGEIYAESELGVGSTFWFRLPIAITEGVAVK